MHSANFLGKQLDTEYGLYLPEYHVPSPVAKTNFINVVGKNGSIDKTAPDGVVYYEDREWGLEFRKTGQDVSGYDLPGISRTICNDLHGRRGEFIFDDDPEWKWVGRIFVDDVNCENNGLIIATIRLITDPFRYKLENISRSFDLSSTAQTITLTNGVKPIIPTIIVSDTASLEFTIKGETFTATFSTGTWRTADLVLFEGDTGISISGYGTITFEYPEASL